MARPLHACAGPPMSAEAAAAAAAAPDAPAAPPVAPPVKHVLSRELQLYFERVAAVLRGGGGHPGPNSESVHGVGAASGRTAAAGAERAGSAAAAVQVQRAVMASLSSDPGLALCSRAIGLGNSRVCCGGGAGAARGDGQPGQRPRFGPVQ